MNSLKSIDPDLSESKITKWKELLIDLLELFFGEHTTWAILEKTCTEDRLVSSCPLRMRTDPQLTFVPLLKLFLVKMGVFLELI